jgi:hypothetical protein
MKKHLNIPAAAAAVAANSAIYLCGCGHCYHAALGPLDICIITLAADGQGGLLLQTESESV